ncbi:hypothetical protein [Pseudodonghicola xiamenensis]|nr:hypothetical protein [Pseudodonghicola xiamenensis]
MLHFVIGLTIGLIIMAPLIALVVGAGVSPKRPPQGPTRRGPSHRAPARYPVVIARGQRPLPGMPG